MEPEQFSGLRVLVVDDDPDSATSLAGLVELYGCDTATAFSAATGCEVAQAFKPAVAFLDLEMPVADGCEALQKLRAMGSNLSDSLFVCLTGCAEASVRERCMEAGFQEVVVKPIQTEVLLELLREGRRRAQGAEGQ